MQRPPLQSHIPPWVDTVLQIVIAVAALMLAFILGCEATKTRYKRAVLDFLADLMRNGPIKVRVRPDGGMSVHDVAGRRTDVGERYGDEMNTESDPDIAAEHIGDPTILFTGEALRIHGDAHARRIAEDGAAAKEMLAAKIRANAKKGGAHVDAV